MLRDLLCHLPQSQIDQLRRIRDKYRRVSPHLLPRQQAKLRAAYSAAMKWLVNGFLSYSPAEFESCVRSLGLCSGDTLLLHSSFGPLSGFRGTPTELIEVFLRILGSEGNLMMVSLPYNSYTYEYLEKGKVFDVRKTPSRMGLVSEIFRRRREVLRSLHPTHPILALGPKAEWIVAGHENIPYPCGFGTPFEKLALLSGKILFFNASFYTNTFYHFLEETIKDNLTFPLYSERLFDVEVIDHEGRTLTVKTFVYSMDAIERRKPEILKSQLKKRGWFRQTSIGNSKLVMIETSQAIRCVKEMADHGIYFYTRV